MTQSVFDSTSIRHLIEREWSNLFFVSAWSDGEHGKLIILRDQPDQITVRFLSLDAENKFKISTWDVPLTDIETIQL